MAIPVCQDTPAHCLYEDLSTSCSYYSDETNFTRIPESTLASIHSSNNCAWLEGIVTRNYTTQDVWRDLLPATTFEPNSTNCYGEQYMVYFNLSIVHDEQYSLDHKWLIPRGLASKSGPCVAKVCRGAGATGNPDMTGIGLRGCCTRRDKAYDNAATKCQCFAVTRHKCAGGAGECGCFAVMIRSGHCTTHRGRGRFAIDRAVGDTTPLFLDTAIFFALSVGIGTVATAFSPEITKYERKVLVYVAFLAQFPLYTVFALSSRTLRRKRLRRNLISLAVILLGLAVGHSEFMVDRDRDRWGVICFGIDSDSVAARSVLTYCLGTLPFACELYRVLFPPISLIFKRCAPSGPRRVVFVQLSTRKPWVHLSTATGWQAPPPPHWQCIRSWVSNKTSIWVVATCSLSFTFYAGGYLYYERRWMQSLAGESYKESEMTYGQYLAALIWVPVLVECGYHLTCGTRVALESRLPTHYTVARPPITAGVRHSGEVRGYGSGEELELERICGAGSSPSPHPSRGAFERKWTHPV